MENHHLELELLKQIEDEIQQFNAMKWDLTSLQGITSRLEEIITQIAGDYKESLRTEWWELELTSSLMIDNNEDQLSKEDEIAVKQALENMQQMIQTILHKSETQ